MLRLHDCTIHEGGYCNNWNFGADIGRHMAFVNELALIGSDVVDVGVLGKAKKNCGSGYFSSFYKVPDMEKIADVKYALTLLSYKDFVNKKIRKVKNIDYIRLVIGNEISISTLNTLNGYCRRLHHGGYQIMIHLECRSDEDTGKLAESICCLPECGADVIVLDNVNGIYSADQMIQLVSALDQKLDSDIALGFRVRNTGNQAQRIMEFTVQNLAGRTAILEASLLGMSRNVSLLELEDAAVYLNFHYGFKYDLTRINSIADIIYKSVKSKISWKTDCISQMISANKINYRSREIAESMQLTIKEMDYLFGRLAACGGRTDDQKKIDSSKCYEIINDYRQQVYKKALAVVIWIDCDSDDLVETYLEEQASNIAQSGIDVYFCSVRPKGGRSNAVMKYRNMEVNGIHWLDNRRGMMDTIQKLLSKYKYIWMNQPEYIINFQYINYQVMPLLNRDYDFIFVENDWYLSGSQGIRCENDVIDIFVNRFLQIYSLGTTVYSADFLEAVQKGAGYEKIKNEIDLARSIFVYLNNHKAHGISYCGDVYLNRNLNHIFHSEFYIWKWTVGLRKLMRALPKIYQRHRAEIFDYNSSFYNPFSKHKIYDLKLSKQPGKRQIWKYVHGSSRLLLMCPAWICKALFKYRYKMAGRIMVRGYRNLTGFLAKVKKLWGHTGVDYEKYVNCIVPQSKVASKLIYGNPDNIPNPWLTVVIPTYKRADLLEDAINSALEQEDINHPWDIVVVDNEAMPEGESNETEKLIRRINHPRILYYRNKKNIGISGNYNRGIELARGKWVSLLHSDDILVKGYLKRMSRQIDIYSKKPGKKLGYISASYLSFYSENLKNDLKWKTELKCRDESFYQQQKKRAAALIRVKRSEFILTGAVGISLPSNGTVMYRQAILEYGGFNDDLGICADMVLPLRLMKKYAVYRTDDIMGHYRVGQRNESSADNNAFKVEENYNTIREYYYRKVFGGKAMGLLFGQQHFFMVDRILGGAYWQDASMHALYPYKKQKIRDHMMFGRYGIVNQFYGMQRRISIIKGKIMTTLLERPKQPERKEGRKNNEIM